MKIIDNYNKNQIKENVLSVAQYQKVVLLVDIDSNNKYIEELLDCLKKDSAVFSCNVDLNDKYIDMLRDGTKCVISLLNDSNYIKVKDELNNIFVVDIFSGEFVIPHLNNRENYFLIVDGEKSISKKDILVIFDALVEEKWNNLLQSKNYSQEEKVVGDIKFLYKTAKIRTKLLINYYNSLSLLHNYTDLSILDISLEDYIVTKWLSYKYLFLSFKYKNFIPVDCYKYYPEDDEMINLMFHIINNERAIFVLNNCYDIMIKFMDDLINTFNSIFGSHNINGSDSKKILVALKKHSMLLKKDSLLKYCLAFGVYNAV